jgi:hypothetical protein
MAFLVGVGGHWSDWFNDTGQNRGMAKNKGGIIIGQSGVTMDLQLLAEVLRENNCQSLINAIAEKDYQMAQVLDVLIVED